MISILALASLLSASAFAAPANSTAARFACAKDSDCALVTTRCGWIAVRSDHRHTEERTPNRALCPDGVEPKPKGAVCRDGLCRRDPELSGRLEPQPATKCEAAADCAAIRGVCGAWTPVHKKDASRERKRIAEQAQRVRCAARPPERRPKAACENAACVIVPAAPAQEKAP